MNTGAKSATEAPRHGELLQEKLTEAIIGAAIEVHRELEPGLLESVYEECLADELTRRGLSFVRQAEIPVVYKGKALAANYRVDLLVENSVIVEIKAVERVPSCAEAQLLTYLRVTGIKVGLILNFNVSVLTRGVMRRVL